MLISAIGGTVSRSMAFPGDKVTLTPDMDGVNKCTGWTAAYTYIKAGEYATTRVDVTGKITVTNNGDGTWGCTLPSFESMGVSGGGSLVFTALFSTCDHSGGTTLAHACEPICLTPGYTGDTVCMDCGYLIDLGDPIPAGTEHTGTLNLVPGTTVIGDCTHRGYEGDYRCSACDGLVRGEKTGYGHVEELVGYVAPPAPSRAIPAIPIAPSATSSSAEAVPCLPATVKPRSAAS